MRRPVPITVAVVAALAAGGSAGPSLAAGWGIPGTAAPSPAPTEVTPPAEASPADDAAPSSPSPAQQLLNAADAAIRAGNLGRAQGIFARLAWEHPDSPQGAEARRALGIIQLRDRGTTARPLAPPGAAVSEVAEKPTDRDSVVVRHEPYSLRTAERLRLTAWEKLDFGVTAFLYGMSLGLTFALGLDNPDPGEVTTPLVLGAAFYTLGAVAYLKVADPDRGDLPLMMAITSYVPTTTLLVSNFAFDNPNEKKVAFATAATGLASVPLAIAITQKLNLDPGDTQLVRDAGFWGLVTFTTGTLGFGRDESFNGDIISSQPSGRTVAGMGLLGLGGGLGLGLLAANTTEVSLERVRVATWGGYGGAVLGALVGASAAGRDAEGGVYKGLTIGALTGLVVTFIASSGLDGIPPSDDDSPKAGLRWVPSLTPLVGAGGRQVPGLGLAGSL